jgi:hypothetical protein
MQRDISLILFGRCFSETIYLMSRRTYLLDDGIATAAATPT